MAETDVAADHLDALGARRRPRRRDARHGTIPSVRLKIAVDGTASADWSSWRRGRFGYIARIHAVGWLSSPGHVAERAAQRDHLANVHGRARAISRA